MLEFVTHVEAMTLLHEFSYDFKRDKLEYTDTKTIADKVHVLC